MPLLSDDEFNQAAGILDAQNQQAQSATMLQGVRTPVQAAAKAVQVGKNLGLPPGFVMMDPEQNELLSKAKTMRDATANSPVLKNWMAEHPLNTALAQNDVHALGGMEGELASRGDNSVLNGILGLSSWLRQTGKTMSDATVEGLASTAKSVNLAIGGVPVLADKALGTNMSDWWFKNMVQPADETAQANAQDPNAPFDQKLIGTVTKLGQMLGEIALTGGGSVEAKIGMEAPGALGMLKTATEHAIKSMWFPATTDAISTGQKVYAQTGDGAAALKAAEMQYVTSTGMGLVPLSAPGGLLYRGATGFVTGAAQGEVSRQAMNAVLPKSMQSEFSWEDTFLSGVAGSLMGTVMGPRGEVNRATMADVIRKSRMADEALGDHTTFDRAATLAGMVEMREHAPEQFKQLVQRFTEDGRVTDVYIEAAKLAEAMDKAGVTADQLRETLPEVARQMKAMLETNGSVRIAPEDYLTHIAGGKLDQPLREEVRLNDPTAPTLKEATEFYQKQADQMNEAAAGLVKQKEEVNAFKESQAKVLDTIHGELNALGRFPAQVNKVYAGIQTSILSRIAAREGITPEAAHAKYGAALKGVAGEGFEQFAGQYSETADKFALETAKSMLKAKRSPEAVRRETGWFQGIDGEWRYEIPDDEAKFITRGVVTPEDVAAEIGDQVKIGPDPQVAGLFKATFGEGDQYRGAFGRTEEDAKANLLRTIAKDRSTGAFDITKVKGGESMPLSEVLDHPKLYAAYPDLARTNVEFVAGKDYRGAYDEGAKKILINLSGDKAQMLSTLLHEIQHAIQAHEGFARGGSPEFSEHVRVALDKLDNRSKQAVEQWKWANADKLSAAEKASQVSRYALMYESAQRLIDYANRDKPSGVFRLLRNELQWIYGEEFRSNEAARDLQRDFYAIPKSHKMSERNAFLSDMAFRGSQLLMAEIPSELRTDFKNDPRTMKGMLGALRREADRRYKDLAPLRELENQARNAEELKSSHRFSSPFELYRSLAGEVEARNTQARQGMTAEERVNTSPTITADTPAHKTVVMFGGLDVHAPMTKGVFNQGEAARGTYSPSERSIALLKDADLSTYLHETGHWALDLYGKIAAGENAPPEIRADMEKILNWFGVESLEKWHAMSLEEQRPHHEAFARGFEAYLFEGKAPSQELAGPFARIRAWMTSIYQTLRNLNVELSDEVRGVFDRMLASEDQIHQAESARLFEPFIEKPAGVTAEEWANYQELGKQATEQAVQTMQAKSLRDMKWLSGAKSRALKDLQKQAKQARDEVRAQVEQQVNDEPVYRMEDWLKANQQATPESKDAVKDWGNRQEAARERVTEEVKAEFLARDEAKDLKGLQKGQYLARMRKEMAAEVDKRMALWERENKRPSLVKPEVDTELLAETFGFGSGEEAMRALADAQPRDQVIEGLTDRRMLEEHGELATPDALEAAANEAVHNEARARFMATGLKMLVNSPIPARELMRGAEEAATTHVNGLQVKDVNPRQYLVAETRANREALKAAPKDPEAAVKAQREALLNNRLVKAAYDAQNLVREALRYAKTFEKAAKRGKIDLDVREQIDDLLGRFDFRQVPKDDNAKQREQLAQWVESQKALGYAPIEVEDMLNPAVRMHYKEMTVEQLRGLMDTIKSLEKIGRDRKKVMIDGQRVNLDEAVAPMIDNFKARGEKFTDAQLAEKPRYGVDPTWRVALDRLQSWLRTMHSELLRADYKANRYDLHQLLGPFQKGFSERLLKASYDYGDLMDRVGQLKREGVKAIGLDKAWQESLNTVVANHGLVDKSLAVPAKRRLTRGDLIGIAMHVGNESNFDKLVRGMQWEPKDIWQALHDNLTEKDWRAAELMGRMAGVGWEEMVAMNRRLGNDTPVKVEPRPFETKFGKMEGWYAPIDYDPIRSRLGKRKAEEKAINPGEGLFGRDYFRADTTTNGSLNARKSNYYDFIDLNFRTLEKRITDTMRDLAYREALIDVHKIYAHKEFRQQFERTFGPEEYRHLGDWLGQLTNAEAGDGDQSKLVAISSSLRRAMVANGVAFRISTMVKHGGSAAFKSTGYFAGGGEKFFAARVAQMSTNYRTQVDEALAKFPEIRQRLRQQDRDFGLAVRSIADPESLHGKAERFGHAGVAWMDFFTAVPTAHAAYDWAITEGIPKRLGGTGKPMSEADAIAFASKVVREAHSSTNEASMSLLMSNRSEAVKTLTTLHGFMNNAFGQNADTLDKVLHANGFGKPELLARTMMAQVVPALMAGWATFGGPNQNESWLGWAFHHVMGEFAGMLPMVREGWSVAVEGFDKAGLPPWMRALQDIAKVGRDAAKGEKVKAPIKDAGNAAGLLLPGLGQGGATAQFLVDVANHKQHPETVGEWIHGVMSGKAKKE